MDAVYVFNIVFLIIGPISAVGLLAWVVLSAKRQASKSHTSPYASSWLIDSLAVDSVSENIIPRGSAAKLKAALKALAGWERFWIALIVSALAHTALIIAFVTLNPYVRVFR